MGKVTKDIKDREERIKYAHKLAKEVSTWSDEKKYAGFSQSNVSETVKD